MNNQKYETSHQMGNLHPILISLLLSFMPLVGLGMTVLGIFTTYASIVVDRYPVFPVLILLVIMLLIAGFFFLLGWAYIASGLAAYRFEKAGLIVKYPLKKEFLIPWCSFQQVCVCRGAYTRGHTKACDIICCVKHGEKRTGSGRWKTENLFKYRSVICIAYSKTLAEGIRDMCPYDVPDLRNSLTYLYFCQRAADGLPEHSKKTGGGSVC